MPGRLAKADPLEAHGGPPGRPDGQTPSPGMAYVAYAMRIPAGHPVTRLLGLTSSGKDGDHHRLLMGLSEPDELLDRYAQEHARELEQHRRYVSSTWGEGARPAAQRISEALNIGLDEVLAAIQKLGPWAPAATLAGEGTLTTGTPAAGAAAQAPGATVLVTAADAGAGNDSLEVVRQIDVDELSERASRGGLARLSANQRILVAVILIAAIFPALPPEARQAITEDAGLAAAIAAVLILLKR